MNAIVYFKEDYQNDREYKTLGLLDIQEGQNYAWHIGRAFGSKKIDFKQIQIGDILENLVLGNDEYSILYKESNVVVKKNDYKRILPLVKKVFLARQKTAIKLIQQFYIEAESEKEFSAYTDQFLLTNFAYEEKIETTDNKLENAKISKLFSLCR